MTGSRLLATMLIGSGAALRVPLRPRMMCDSSFRSPMEPSTAGLNDAQKKILMDQMQQGVDSGGWDNDEYLEATKANKPVTSNKELLRQSEAYMDMLNAKMLRPSPEVVAEIERIKSAMTPEEMQEYEAEKAARLAAGPPPPPAPPAPPPQAAPPPCSSSSLAPPPAPAPVNVNARRRRRHEPRHPRHVLRPRRSRRNRRRPCRRRRSRPLRCHRRRRAARRSPPPPLAGEGLLMMGTAASLAAGGQRRRPAAPAAGEGLL